MLSFVDVVTARRKYFHPLASGRLVQPPNYLAFRWDGRLQSIHHVDRYEVITRWHPHFPDTTEPEIPAHFLYHLGPPMTPHRPVPTGNIYASGRVWAAIDLLLTSETIAAAMDETQRRREVAAAS